MEKVGKNLLVLKHIEKGQIEKHVKAKTKQTKN